MGDYTIRKSKKGYVIQAPGFGATAKTLSLAKKRVQREDALSPKGWNGDDRLATKKSEHHDLETVGSHLRIKNRNDGRVIHDKKYPSAAEAWKVAEEKVAVYDRIERGRQRSR